MNFAQLLRVVDNILNQVQDLLLTGIPELVNYRFVAISVLFCTRPSMFGFNDDIWDKRFSKALMWRAAIG